MKEYTDADITIQIPDYADVLAAANKIIISVRDQKGDILNRDATVDEDTVSIHLSPEDFNTLKPGIIEIEASIFDSDGLVAKTETVKDKILPSVASVILYDTET